MVPFNKQDLLGSLNSVPKKNRWMVPHKYDLTTYILVIMVGLGLGDEGMLGEMGVKLFSAALLFMAELELLFRT